jgi:phage-related protein
LDWLAELPDKVRDKCRVRLDRLAELGHELRRPEADYLRNGIYELRASLSGVQYRILYFFCGTAAVVVSHGLTKEQQVPAVEIDRAVWRKIQFERDPKTHTYEGTF